VRVMRGCDGDVTLTKAQLKEAMRILASRAGSTKSPAKSEAARINGRKGGRPRKN
jgi:hypothetical protein